jgi:Transcriptional regulator, AbiEi antitoxin
MRDAADALRTITREHQVFLRREALELGLEDRVLRKAIRQNQLVKVRHGAYAFADDWSALDELGRHRVLGRAALRTLGDRVAASHHTACALLDLDLWDVPLDVAHVTRLDGGAGRQESDLWHHEGLVLPEDVRLMNGFQVMRPARAALESAMLSGIERGLVTVNSGLHRKLYDSADLTAQHELMQSWPDSQHLHVVTRLADGRIESVGESRALFLFWSQRLPMPELQFEVREGGRLVAVTDFAWPEHKLIVEFDGRLKYQKYLQPGEEAGDAVFREKRREDWVRRLTGWRVVRLVWADLAHPVRTAVMLRSMMIAAA